MQQQLQDSERWDPEILRRHQFDQIHRVVEHARATVPYYAEQLSDHAADTPQALAESWSALPLLSRAALQEAGDALLSGAIPKGHERLSKIQTSGSTGRPVRAYGTDVTRFLWLTFTLREHLWHERDFGGKLLAIRPELELPANTPKQLPGWGPSTDAVYPTAPSIVLSSHSDMDVQARVLAEFAPAYLLTLPSNAVELADHCAQHGIEVPALRQVRTYAEAISERVRERCRTVWGVPLVDVYTAQEAGYIALQCPTHEHYHVQVENLLVEVLNEADEPCRAGQVGRVVVTTLHNFAMPLIRYEIGDYARVGGDRCACGRRLSVIETVLGRERNMLVLPDGRKLWPSFPSEFWADLPIRQLQLVQTELEHIQARLVASRTLNADEEARFRNMLRERFRYDFAVTLEYCATIERTAGGKYEDFVCRVERPG